MTDRPVRDILAEMMRRERLGLIYPLWHRAVEISPEACEAMRRRADHLMRLLDTEGLALVRVGDREPEPPPPESNVIWRAGLSGRNAERIIRKGEGQRWETALIVDGQETVEQFFTVDHALLNGGLVLTDHPDMKTVAGLGRQLAALNEIYRLNAAGMEHRP